VQRVLADLQVAIKEQRAEVTVDKLPVVSADGKQLAMVFQNLISNAIKFHEKGAVPKVHVAAQETESGWFFSVQDNGIGISAEEQQRLFQIFHRVNSL